MTPGTPIALEEEQPPSRSRSGWMSFARSALVVALIGIAIAVMTSIKHAQQAAMIPAPQHPEWSNVSQSIVIENAIAADDPHDMYMLFRKPAMWRSLNPASVTLLAQDRTKRVLGAILALGFDPDGLGKDGSPLLAALSNGQYEAVRVLVRFGANPTLGSKGAQTPLDYAKSHRVPSEIVKLLVAAQPKAAAKASR
ncbi:MAG TPA: ankyrin repeat domain-containing protein [Fimbriimonadaceae bacterium]|nr:ankyrin repeat domain-containing protein [Fimbriimonadaceae bacterium]